MAALISCKIEEYWMIMDSASAVSAILDSWSKLSVFSDESKLVARAHVQSVYELYKGQSLSPTISIPSTPVRKNRQYFTLLRQNAVLTDENEVPASELEPESETELSRYLEQPTDEETEPLIWWHVHLNDFPVLNTIIWLEII